MDHAHLQQAQEQTAYTLDLYKQVLKLEESKDNAVMSPMSIATALAMTAGGCRGETLAQFAAHLKHPDSENMHQLSMQIKNSIFREGSDSAGPYLSSATGLWVDERTPLNPKFRRFVKHNYGGEAQEADFRNKVGTLHSVSEDLSLFRLKPRCFSPALLKPQSVHACRKGIRVDDFVLSSPRRNPKLGKIDAKLIRSIFMASVIIM